MRRRNLAGITIVALVVALSAATALAGEMERGEDPTRVRAEAAVTVAAAEAPDEEARTVRVRDRDRVRENDGSTDFVGDLDPLRARQRDEVDEPDRDCTSGDCITDLPFWRRCYNWIVHHTDIRPPDDLRHLWRLCHRLQAAHNAPL